MNYAFTNGKILDGTRDMQVQTGLCILVQDGTITDIVPDTADLIVTAKNPLDDRASGNHHIYVAECTQII